MKKYKSLVIYDWDDTIFPTSWFTKNNVLDELVANNTSFYFLELDKLAHLLLSETIKNSRVIIITNASMSWFNLSAKILPKTKDFIKNYVNVFSARDMYQNTYPTEVKMWKRVLFKNVIDKYYDKHLYRNIVSVGDNDYELEPIRDRYDGHAYIKNKLLKTVKFKKSPTNVDVINQLKIILINIDKILSEKNHLDLKFITAKY